MKTRHETEIYGKNEHKSGQECGIDPREKVSCPKACQKFKN